MSRRGWLHVVAAGGLILVLAEARYGYCQNPSPEVLAEPENPVTGEAIPGAGGDQKVKDASTSDRAGTNGPKEPESAATAKEPGIEEPARSTEVQKNSRKCDATCRREKQDLRAQKGMANAAWAMFWTALVSVLLTTTGIFLIYRTLHYTRVAAKAAEEAVVEARETTKAAKAAFAAENRTWLKLEAADVRRVFFKDGSLRVSANVRAENIGKVPAVVVRFGLEAYRGAGMLAHQ